MEKTKTESICFENSLQEYISDLINLFFGFFGLFFIYIYLKQLEIEVFDVTNTYFESKLRSDRLDLT